MEVTVYNTSFELVYVLDAYESLLWVDKYSEPGTFEIYTPVSSDILEYLKPNYYLVNDASEHTMIIEDMAIESDIESGNKIKIIGRSLESILDRRIIWDTISFKENHNFHKAIKKLITRCFITPDGQTGDKARRKVTNFKFEDSTDTSITSLKLEDGAQYHGQTLLDIVKGLCDEKNVGFKITLSESNEFVFKLYKGVDRSYVQDTLTYVVFSPEFDNVTSSNYKEENSKFKNLACVLGAEDSGGDKEELVVGDTTATGLNRREMFIDAGDIEWDAQQEDDEGEKTTISASQYRKLMKQRGEKDLKENKKSLKTFDAQCDTSRMYVYGTDFFIGDIVQLANEYGMESTSRITEFTWSSSTEGIQTYPTFEAVDEEGGAS